MEKWRHGETGQRKIDRKRGRGKSRERERDFLLFLKELDYTFADKIMVITG